MFSILNPDGFQLLGMEILKSPITNSPESRASCKKLAAQKKGQIHWVSCFNDNKKKQFQESCHPITAKPQNSLFCPRSFQPSHHFSVVNRTSGKQEIRQLFGSHQGRSDENFNLSSCCAAQKPGSLREKYLHNT